MRSGTLFAALGVVGLVTGLRFLGGPASAVVPDAGTHGAWYGSRAAGLASYLMLWVALTGGVLMSSAWFDGMVNRGRLLAVHQVAAFSGLALGVAHALLLIPDSWTDFGVVDLFVPFASSYERALTGIGTTTLYLFAIVTFSFWARGVLGTSVWRWIHYASAIAFAGAAWHGIQLGSDSEASWAVALYLGTTMVLLGAVILRVTYLRPLRRPAAKAVPVGQD
ncbi:MAG: hypothetical protein Kow0010_02380 [Dehalococcoidia bacterium]